MARRRIKPPSSVFSKEDIRRELKRDAKRDLAAKIRRLRAEAAAAKKRRAEAKRRALKSCQAERDAGLAKARGLYRDAATLRAEARRIKEDARKRSCRIEAKAVETEETAKVELARKELEAERAYRRELEGREQSQRSREQEQRALSKAAERRAESDDEVAANIEAEDPGLLPLWEKLKRSIKGSRLKSRTETFLQYVEEHPEEVIAARGETSDEAFAREAYGAAAYDEAPF